MKRKLKQRFYTVSEAAQILRFSPITLYRWIKAGKLKAVKVGYRNYRIKREDLVFYLNQ